MKRFRKCDATKYRRRRQREKGAHAAHQVRRCQEEAQRAAATRAYIEAAQATLRERRRLEQALVNVLAARICQLNPEYSAYLRLLEITRAVGWVARENHMINILNIPITLDDISEVTVIRGAGT